ncbi:MAG: cobalamin biosynthesis protein CobQ [Oscillospiraceae bacterium]
MELKKVTVLTGNYGCGKTNLAVNLALSLANKNRVSIVDFDTVNPYFRTADFTEMLENKGINVVYPQYAGTNLGVPILNFDLEEIILNSNYTIIDVGGSDAGAYPLGRYKRLFEKLGSDIDILYVFNMYRHIGNSTDEALQMMREIENAVGLSCTALVNNSNLGLDTTTETVNQSLDFANDLEKPISFTLKTDFRELM